MFLTILDNCYSSGAYVPFSDREDKSAWNAARHVKIVGAICLCLFPRVWSAKTWIPPNGAPWLTTPLHRAVKEFWDLLSISVVIFLWLFPTQNRSVVVIRCIHFFLYTIHELPSPIISSSAPFWHRKMTKFVHEVSMKFTRSSWWFWASQHHVKISPRISSMSQRHIIMLEVKLEWLTGSWEHRSVCKQKRTCQRLVYRATWVYGLSHSGRYTACQCSKG